jgi:Mg-chelatase subunit ChlI
LDLRILKGRLDQLCFWPSHNFSGPTWVGKTTLSLNIAKKLPEIEVYDCPYNCSVDKPKCEVCKAVNPKRSKLKEHRDL